MAYKIERDEDKCIGCGACVSVCPVNWEMEDDKAKPIQEEVDELGCNKDAEDICPVQCITITEV